MFEIRKSVRRFREDPAWEYQGLVKVEYPDWNPLGYPFSIGFFHDRLQKVLRGEVAGHRVLLAHVAVNSEQGHISDFSIAALDLPLVLPDTAMTEFGLARRAGSRARPIPDGPWQQRPAHLVGSGKGSVDLVCADGEFGRLVATKEIQQLTAEAGCGWRIDRSRLIGWVSKYRPYEEIIDLAQTMAAITAAFPPAVWQWRDSS
ncbi:hypothetical protein ABH930_003636 [Kitasatospora sp. GAS204A]|uniref:hypothetical protein n=1 Tax=unclassified Kitasatospora TaxID=2633591 RepID=UPI0024746112|nr:hypothetical protein [Kitasatospora sp. GAS204B]MDH6118691.1 hypothetical protein [Kitasatospora sp. GAS204B]